MKFARAIKLFRLTPRQSQVAQLVGRGMPQKQIADELKISVRTVESYLQDLRWKTQTRSTYQLVSVFSRYS
jgi:DNA-binding NarL/FixJ family response regulator